MGITYHPGQMGGEECGNLLDSLKFAREEMGLKLYDDLLEVISEVSGIEKSKIDLTNKLTDLGIDSLKLVDLVMRLEEKIGVEISDNYVLQMMESYHSGFPCEETRESKVPTIGDIQNYIEEQFPMTRRPKH